MDAPGPMTEIRTAQKTAYVETYGCQMNVSDGELMQGVLAAHGYELVARPEDADVVLVNTCAIREHAEQRVIGRVGELNRLKVARPDMVIGVTGCMAQRLGSKLLDQASYVDLVMGPDGYRDLPQALGRIRPDHPAAVPAPPPMRGRELPVLGAVAASAPGPAAGAMTGRMRAEPPAGARSHAAEETSARAQMPGALPVEPPAGPRSHAAETSDRLALGDRLALLEFRGDENYEGLEVRRSSSIGAWVPVQRGCDYRCTYCIVPYVRGPEKNRRGAAFSTKSAHSGAGNHRGDAARSDRELVEP
jgi:tRNA A37 methylthiotransferase MiaB